MKIIKIFNNNSIAALSDELGDIILTGSGIGFQKKIGDLVDESRIEKTYIFKEKVEKRIRRGINDIEPIYYEITSLLVSKEKKKKLIYLMLFYRKRKQFIKMNIN